MGNSNEKFLFYEKKTAKNKFFIDIINDEMHAHKCPTFKKWRDEIYIPDPIYQKELEGQYLYFTYNDLTGIYKKRENINEDYSKSFFIFPIAKNSKKYEYESNCYKSKRSAIFY